MLLAAGDIVAERYRLDQPLGEGGMAVVWAATHVLTGESVALKFVSTEIDGRSGEVRKRFLREARAGSLINHPAIIPVHDVIELATGRLVMVMERLYGETLRHRLERERKLSLSDGADIMLQVVSAAGAAHAAGMVHRDLKPENVFLSTRPPPVRVLDFGIAKLTNKAEAPADSVTRTGSVLGTPHYMPPEQIFAEKDLDARADVWSIGVMLYECLSGVLPFDGDNAGQVLKAILETTPRPLDQLVPELPAPIVALIHRMLRNKRSERPSDLQEAFELLRSQTIESAPSFGPAQAPHPTLSAPGGSSPDASAPHLIAELPHMATARSHDTAMPVATLASATVGRQRPLLIAVVALLGLIAGSALAVTAIGAAPQASRLARAPLSWPSAVAAPPPPAAATSAPPEPAPSAAASSVATSAIHARTVAAPQRSATRAPAGPPAKLPGGVAAEVPF